MEQAVQAFARTACSLHPAALLDMIKDRMTLAQRELIALVEAAALSERQSVRRIETASVLTTAEDWTGKVIHDSGVLAEYLAAQSLDKQGLEALLNGGAWKPRHGCMTWVRHIEPWLLSNMYRRTSKSPVVVENTELSGMPFPALLEPIAASQDTFLDQWSWLAVEARASLQTYLRERIATLTLRCLLDELAAKGDYVALNNSFSERERRLAFFMRYPLLARDLVASISDWRRVVRLLLSRFVSDIHELRSLDIVPPGQGKIQSIMFSGDRHNGGQTVAILRFEGGCRLVYKPRDCGVFGLFRGFLDVLAAELPAEERLYCPKCLARPGYGWIEFIDQASDVVRPELYLQKLGALLAVAHVLGASDLHLENVVASSEGPVPIDLETLIQNRSRSDGRTTAATKAAALLNSSVLGTGILPVQVVAGESASIDVSVVTGGLDVENTPSALVHKVVDPFTDRMRVEPVSVPVGRSNNQPPGMTAALVRNYREALVRGYRDTCRAIMAKRPQLVTFLVTTPDLTLRHIARATRSYELLLTELRQPSRLRSGIARDDLLRRLWARLHDNPGDEPIIGSEQQSLRQLDVPLFYTALDSRSLCDGESEVIPNYFDQSTRRDLVARVEALDEAVIAGSMRLIEESILAATPAVVVRHPTAKKAARYVENPTTLFQDLGRVQAKTLVDTAIFGVDDVTWISVASSTDSTGLEYRPLGPTLYDGLAGIAFATVYAHRVFPDLGLDELARRTAHAISGVLADWVEARLTLPVGAFSGATGLLYALAHYDAEFGTSRYQDLRHAAVRRLRDAVASDTYLDVMAGAAGAIAVLTSEPLGRVNGSEVAVTLRALTDHLLDNAVQIDDTTIVWETGQARARLGGFSHGATGIGWALARAAAVLDDAALAGAARRALRFDDTLFDSDRKRWLDARPESLAQGQLFPVHWCHGAAGISMARACAADILGDEPLREHARTAAHITATSPLPTDDSLCHGTLGNLLSIECAANSATACAEFSAFRSAIGHRLSGSTLKCGMPDGITTVRGLMLGTAGFVYALSKQVDRSIPNVLWLE